jgi:uncharacterized membrane protein (UPF0127 family)
MIHKIQVAILALLIPIGGLYLYTESQGIPFRNIFSLKNQVVLVGEIPIIVDVADTQIERVQGLSGRSKMDNSNGMLFVFDTADYHEIWMKDMLFPIDIIWIGEDLKVISIDSAVQPSSYPKKYRPTRPARYAVETNERFTDMFIITPGNTVRLPSW